jgi:long-chain acyl-CoA synthetase
MSTLTKFSTLTEMFSQITARYEANGRTLLWHKSGGAYRSISYADMKQRVEECACGFSRYGIGRGDRVALISENRPEWMIVDFALMYLGAITVPLYPALTASQTEYILRDAAVRAVVVSQKAQIDKILLIRHALPTLGNVFHFTDERVEEAGVFPFSLLMTDGGRHRADHPGFAAAEGARAVPDDILTLIYTSGTTGTPKGVILTHRNLVSNMIASADSIDFSDRDIVLSFLPLCHSYERMAGYYTAMACGVTIAYAEGIETVLENLLEIRPTVVTTVPRLFERIYQRLMKQVNAGPAWRRLMLDKAIAVGKQYHRERKNRRVTPLTRIAHALADRAVFRSVRARFGGRIRFFVSGGAALSAELGEFFEAAGILIIEGYGMTETSPVISFNRLEQYRFGTVGTAIPGVAIRIAGDGEILVRGPNVMKGYWNDEAATRAMIDQEGWLSTGDIGNLSEDGFLTITDRKKHLFVSSGGKNIAPQQIEKIFLQSPLIEQFVLIGDGKMYLTGIVVPNFESLRDLARSLGLGAKPVAELVRDDSIYRRYEEVFRDLQKDLARYERVRKFVLLDHPLSIENGELTPSQKIRRRVVEERYRHLIEKMYEGVS